MKTGQQIYVGKARLPATYHGTDATGRVMALLQGRLLYYQPENVRGNQRRANGRPKKWVVGMACMVEIDGRTFAAELLSVKPKKCLVTERDPVWFGAVVSERDGKIEVGG
jgi:hypothetical protein